MSCHWDPLSQAEEDGRRRRTDGPKMMMNTKRDGGVRNGVLLIRIRRSLDQISQEEDDGELKTHSPSF